VKLQTSVKTVSRVLMISTIILISAFQFYWINRLYNDEWQNLKKESDVIFRDVVYRLQLQRFRNDTLLLRKGIPDNLFVFDVMDSLKEKFVDSSMQGHLNGKQREVMISITGGPHESINDTEIIKQTADSFSMPVPAPHGPPRLIRYFSSNKTLNDSLSLHQIDSAYKAELVKNGITLPFTVKSFSGKENELRNTIKPDELKTNFTFVGLSQVHAYQAEFANPFAYLVNSIKFQVLFSLLLIAITLLSFIFLYRNLVNQRRLAVMKNEFISNITHELKTPIATVNVAIEALRNFNAIQSPEKTKEYLDISASELQRLSLLVDKVLRLSMFENKEIELKKEKFDLFQLTEEIIATMKLQFDRVNATISLAKEGDRFVIDADKLHITSMIYNLLDNALKYSVEKPEITVKIISHAGYVELRVSDKGIGIAPEYKQKVFEKFFRVPSNAHHNTKGYGLGLSYVSHIAKRHLGFVEVESEVGKGSTFSVKLPYEEANVINYDRGRIIRKVKL
jgi:two-component system phosphate regulon sensor histidine kinase PhoR